MITRNSTANVPTAWNVDASMDEGIVGILNMERFTIGWSTNRSMKANTMTNATPTQRAA